MKKGFASLLLAFAGAASAAGPALKVNFVVTGAAASEFVSNSTTALSRITAQMGNFAAALSNLGCSGGNPTVGYTISTTSAPEIGSWLPTTDLGTYARAFLYNNDLAVAADHDSTDADMTVVIVAGSGYGATVLPGYIPGDAHHAIAFIDVGKILDPEANGMVVAHELGHILGARHYDDGDPGNAHGYYVRQGGYTTTQTCVNDIMTYASQSGVRPGIPLSSCAGWGNPFATLPVSPLNVGNIPFTCSEQDYCTMVARVVGPASYAPPTLTPGYTNFAGVLAGGGVCDVQGTPAGGGVQAHLYGYSMGLPGVSSRGASQPDIPCNVTRVARYSNPSDTSQNGYAIGDSTHNNAAAICANAGTVANFHYSSMVKFVNSTRWAPGGTRPTN